MVAADFPRPTSPRRCGRWSASSSPG